MADITIERYRGDTVPDEFQVTDENGAPQNITGATFRFTLDTRRSPPDATTKVLELVGTITSASGGIVQFTWTALDADQTPGTYWFDIEMIDAASKVETLVIGKYTIIQDIGK